MPQINLNIIRQDVRRPVIYLDHWAVMRLSEQAYAERFVNSVRAAKGTVLLTMNMLTEFHAVESEHSAALAEALFNRLMPNVYISNPSLMGEGDEAYPDTDVRMLSIVALAPVPMDVTGLFTAAPQADEKDKAAFASFCTAIAKSIQLEKSDPVVFKRAKAWRPDPDAPLLSNLLKGLKRQALLDPMGKFDEHDSSDLLHALHSAKYADYALLDGKWADRVRQVQDYFRKHGVVAPALCTYSERKDGLEQFLSHLERRNPGEAQLIYSFQMDLADAKVNF